MRNALIVFLLLLVPPMVLGETHVTQIHVYPENPDPMVPFHIYVTVTLPDRCWDQGPVGDLEFTDVDSYAGEPCSVVLFNYMIDFDVEGLPEGQHTLTVTENHQSTRDPGPYEQPIEIVVGDPIVGTEARAWSAVKSLYR